MLKNRIAAARAYLERFDVDAILFSDLCDIRYLCGFTGSEGTLLLNDSYAGFLTDSRYTSQASREVSGCTVVEFREKVPTIASLVGEMKAVKLGFQPESLNVASYHALQRSMPDVKLAPLGPEASMLRVVKDDTEIGCLARTAEIASGAFHAILPSIRTGAAERDVAFQLEFAMRTAGADDKSFDIIVASGERGALPHGRAGSRVLSHGDLVTIDFGAVLDGYHSDETVTVAVGEPDPRLRDVYRIVKEAHDLAIDAVRPGIPLKELDAVARDFIARQGYGEFFGHGLGHGVGLDVHEKPVVSFRSEGNVLEGMVFTIEPGIYLPGLGGVRIEDTVCVTSNGCRLLTLVPKDLMIV
ncbi:MAG: Xaa-Pro peptidase family protein [Geobacteraceae bacterium]|nr:Xaa-Pro peptidase family protein [Geobacteraceae bacterium]